MSELELRLAETSTSTWHYHVVSRPSSDPLMQGQRKGVCGKSFQGWDTEIPFSTWGRVSHLRESYCSECTEWLAEKERQDG